MKSFCETQSELYIESITNVIIDFYVFKQITYYVIIYSLADKLQNSLLLNQTAV